MRSEERKIKALNFLKNGLTISLIISFFDFYYAFLSSVASFSGSISIYFNKTLDPIDLKGKRQRSRRFSILHEERLACAAHMNSGLLRSLALDQAIVHLAQGDLSAIERPIVDQYASIQVCRLFKKSLDDQGMHALLSVLASYKATSEMSMPCYDDSPSQRAIQYEYARFWLFPRTYRGALSDFYRLRLISKAFRATVDRYLARLPASYNFFEQHRFFKGPSDKDNRRAFMHAVETFQIFCAAPLPFWVQQSPEQPPGCHRYQEKESAKRLLYDLQRYAPGSCREKRHEVASQTDAFDVIALNHGASLPDALVCEHLLPYCMPKF